jgi:hypothetical protein
MIRHRSFKRCAGSSPGHVVRAGKWQDLVDKLSVRGVASLLGKGYAIEIGVIAGLLGKRGESYTVQDENTVTVFEAHE